jgi:quercetin dioxygenase-like cupin family protein
MTNSKQTEALAQPEQPIQQMRIIHREDIPTLRTVVVDGVEHNLGILKDLRAHPDLKDFIPENGRLAVSWVHLEPNETLQPHVHPIESMIIVARGQGRTIGDLQEDFFEGDIVTIPRGCLHGFVGVDEGLWALSIQFEERGLYEDPSNALVQFQDRKAPRAAEGEPSFELLIERNRQYCDEHRNNPLFELIQSGRLDDNRCRQRFLDAVQVWSNWFQKAMMARSVFNEDPRFVSLFQQHLDEEYGHNTKLAADRGGQREPLWDPILEATSTWFVWKMLSLDNLEKTVLIHLVLEAAASTFHPMAQPIMDVYHETDYFALHNEADDEHEVMALEYLKGYQPEIYRRLMRVQKEGWEMFNTLCARMVALADEAPR